MTLDPGVPPVVRAKLTQPHALPAQIRPSTLELMRHGLEGRLTLVCAPGGYGKTTLALEALRTTGLPSAWYRIDELDRDPVVFLASVTEAVSARVPGFGDRIRGRLQTAKDGHASSKELAAVFVTDLGDHLSGSLHLVIDDYHEAIDSEGFNGTLEYLLTAAPDSLRFVILSRYEPAFAVSKMKLAGEITSLGVDQLRLTAQETRLLLEQRGHVLLDEASADRLAQLTQGWPASIALASMTLHWLDFPSIEAAMADPRLTRDVYSYLTEQVYAREKPSTQAFLLETCCLDYVSPRLANDVAGREDGHAQLDHLMANQIFIARGEGEDECRYHPLLRDFLRQRFLRERGANAYHELQVHSAEAMERAGDLPSAIAAYLTANEGEQALSVIARAGFGSLEDTRADTLSEWLSRLQTSLRAHPWALVLQPHLLCRSGRYEESVRFADDALDKFAATGDRAGGYQALCAKETALFWKGDNEGAREASQRALEAAQTTEERVHALIGLAAACEGQCRWSEALASLDEAATLARLTVTGEESRAVAHRATVFYLTGRFREAELQFTAAANVDDDGTSLGLRVGVMHAHGSAFLGLGRYDEAFAKFSRGTALAEAQGYRYYAAMLMSSMSQVHLAQARHTEAAQLAQFAADSGFLSEDAFSQSYAFSHLGTVYRRTGSLREAEKAYERAVHVASEGDSLHAHVNASSNLAFTLGCQGEDSALHSLGTLHAQAMKMGMLFLAAKSSFYRAATLYQGKRRREAIEGLRNWAADAVHLGHLGFLSQELALLPEMTLDYLAKETRQGLRTSVVQALALSPHSLPLFVRLLDEPRLAATCLRASSALPLEARRRLARRASRHRDAEVRRIAGSLLKTIGPTEGDSGLSGLTPREGEVLRLIAGGMSNEDIARSLYVAPSTVKTHINRIFTKLGATSRVQAVNIYKEAVERLR